MHNFLLLTFWPLASITTIFTVLIIATSSPIQKGAVKGTSTSQNVQLHTSYQLYTSLPTNQSVIEERIDVTEARTEIINQFLARYDSPLLPYAQLLVDTADKYHLDFRLLPAIAMQESGLCKKIPSDSYNCWGYGVYGDKVLRFQSYEEATEKVGKGLFSEYVFDGLTTPELIMSRYTPASDGSWARAVRHFMEEMD